MTLLKNDGLANENVQPLLEEIAKDHKFQTKKIVITPDNNGSKNVEIKDTEKTLNLIVKKLSDTEKLIYTDVLPEFLQLQHESHILDPFETFTKCYKTTKSGEAIINNLRKAGFVRVFNFDYDHVNAIVVEFGKLHAMSIGVHYRKPEKFAEFSRALVNEHLLKAVEYEKRKGCIRERLRSLGVDGEKKLLDFEESVGDLGKDAADAIVHGGSSKNMLFKNQKNSEHPVEVCFPDWQSARIGSPAFDLSYFLFTSTDRQFRLTKYEYMLQVYYGSLATYLHMLGINPNNVIKYSTLQEHMKKYSIYVLYMYYYSMDSEKGSDQEFIDSKLNEILTDMKKYGYL